MRMNKRLRLFTHVEAGNQFEQLNDDDLKLFIRLGNDYSQNYYEYEIPLQVTPWGSSDPGIVWPASNEIDLAFEELTNLKLNRDKAQISNSIIYQEQERDGEGVIKVLGAPNLGNVRTIMIGVRNSKKRSLGSLDDGLDKCAEVWVNELRMTDFDNRGGDRKSVV